MPDVDVQFEPEFTREMPIALFSPWHRGQVHLCAALGLDTRDVARSYAIYADGIATGYTPRANIDRLKVAIAAQALPHLEALLHQYASDAAELARAPRVATDRSFVTQLMRGFILSFLLGDMPAHPLQQEAMRLRTETETVFPQLWAVLALRAPNPNDAAFYTYDELCAGTVISRDAVAFRRSCELVGDGVRARSASSQRKDIPRPDAGTIHGVPAYPGIIRGRVRIIRRADSAALLEDGEVLVTPMTSPRSTPVLHRVAAIVTDEGGITCHAAIVSRELQKPCIIGTKVATKVLKDGDLVEVDATAGVVRVLPTA